MNNSTRLKKWLRLQHGRSSQLARELGISRQSLFHYTSDRSLPSLLNQLAIDTATQGKVPISGWPPSRQTGRPRKTDTN
jgi:DNA-binding XRE family transcriptional regulator